MSSTVRVHPDVIVYRSHTTEVSCPVPDSAFSALPTVHGASVVSAPSIVYGPRFISSSQTVVIPGYPYVINTGRIYMDPTVATLVLCEETHQAAPVTPVSAPTPVEMMEMWIAIGVNLRNSRRQNLLPSKRMPCVSHLKKVIMSWLSNSIWKIEIMSWLSSWHHLLVVMTMKRKTIDFLHSFLFYFFTL